jgi:N-methylhydantoinase A/oxoprolinase/acetone carboxylase beta subunit
MEIVDCRVQVIGRIEKPPLQPLAAGGDVSIARKGPRRAYFAELRGYVETEVVDGDKLGAGNVLEGPSIVEETAMSIVVPPNFRCVVDPYGNYLLTRMGHDG